MLGALIFWIIVGLIAGALAKFIMPGDDPGGFIITIILGIAGALVGGFLASLIGSPGPLFTIIEIKSSNHGNAKSYCPSVASTA
jgi:uncharacterized membrane protein YeaQ/YmgE (transglycosylase-associated protein family)